jgi:hypothetical protein
MAELTAAKYGYEIPAPRPVSPTAAIESGCTA